ncbi:MAG: thioredoxin family protein [Deltaproteobacteria bacterium]|nr:thioredoxin family protein [Deltaproteobacteria bacterium]
MMMKKIALAILLIPLVLVACGNSTSDGTDTQVGQDATMETACIPDCSLTWCGGDDGCGGKCTTCPTNSTCNTASWTCECIGSWCEGNCCLPKQTCGTDGTCLGEGCVPDCGGKWCGADDGCGGKCTACPDNATCNSVTWFCDCPTDWCGGNCCAAGQKCGADQTCETCFPDCTDKACGDDGCGGTCGACEAGQTCNSGACVTCTCDDKECGDDGCGVSCGTCADGKTCQEGQCVIHCDSDGFDGPVINASWKPMEGMDSPKGNFVFSSDTTSGFPYSGLLLIIRQYSTYKGPTGPGTYQITDDDFANCDICMLMFENCTESKCDRIYLAQEGTIDISKLDGANGPFEATLHNVVMREAVIGAEDFSTKIVDDGKNWCLDGKQMSSNEVNLDVPEPECVPEGTGTTLDKNIEDFSLTNCNGQQVSLHDFCKKTKAVWIIMVTGWCPYCAELVDQATQILKDYAPDVEIWVVLGEDVNGNTPDQQECVAYANKHNFPRNRTFYDAGWQELIKHISPVYMSGVPYSMILDGDNMAYTWSSAYAGSINQTLNSLLND